MNAAAERAATIELLHRKFAGVLFDLCLRILKDRGRAEDAVQETFINAFRSLDSFTYGENHLPWLYRIATNTCLKSIRAQKRGEIPVLTEVIAAAAGKESNAESRLHAHYVVEKLNNELDPRMQEILIAHFIGGMDQGQVAQSLGISRRAVVKRLTRLRSLAIQLWEGRDHE